MKLSELAPGSSGFRAGMQPPWSACRACTSLVVICAHPRQVHRARPGVRRHEASSGMGRGLKSPGEESTACNPCGPT